MPFGDFLCAYGFRVEFCAEMRYTDFCRNVKNTGNPFLRSVAWKFANKRF